MKEKAAKNEVKKQEKKIEKPKVESDKEQFPEAKGRYARRPMSRMNR